MSCELSNLYSWAQNNNYILTIKLYPNNKIVLLAYRNSPSKHKKTDYDTWENHKNLIRRFMGKNTTVYIF